MGGPVIIDRPPPPVEADPRGGGGGWALLCTADDLYEAEMIRGVLAEVGIERIHLEPVEIVGSWMLPSGYERTPQRVFVLRTELERARLALLDVGAEAPEPEPRATGGPFGPHDRATKLMLVAMLVPVVALILRALGVLFGGLPG